MPKIFLANHANAPNVKPVVNFLLLISARFPASSRITELLINPQTKSS